MQEIFYFWQQTKIYWILTGKQLILLLAFPSHVFPYNFREIGRPIPNLAKRLSFMLSTIVAFFKKSQIKKH
jgi:hypothetical protein